MLMDNLLGGQQPQPGASVRTLGGEELGEHLAANLVIHPLAIVDDLVDQHAVFFTRRDGHQVFAFSVTEGAGVDRVGYQIGQTGMDAFFV